MSTYKGNVPLVSATAFNVPAGSAITGGNTVHGTIVTTGTTGRWVQGNKILCRRLLAALETTTVGANVTEAKVYLMVADDANGTNAAAVTGADFAVTPVAAKCFTNELPVSAIDHAKFYGLGISYKASTTTANTGAASALGFLLDPFASA